MPVPGVCVQGPEDSPVPQAVYTFVNPGNRLRIADRHGVQAPVIHAEPQDTIFLVRALREPPSRSMRQELPLLAPTFCPLRPSLCHASGCPHDAVQIGTALHLPLGRSRATGWTLGRDGRLTCCGTAIILAVLRPIGLLRRFRSGPYRASSWRR